MATDGFEWRFTISDFDRLSARFRTEAVAVSHDAGAAELQKLREFRVVDLRAGHDDAGTEIRFRVRSPLADLLERLLQVRQDQFVRADLTDELDDMELIARHGRVVQFPEVADLRDDRADFIVVFDGGHQSVV